MVPKRRLMSRWIKPVSRPAAALAIKTELYGPSHASLAPTLNGLGILLAGQDQLVAAEDLYRRALAINTASFGPNHVRVTSPLINLGVVLLRVGWLDEALEATRRARAILAASQGAGNPEVIALDCNKATILAARGRMVEAIALRRTTLEVLTAQGQDAESLVAGCLADATKEQLARDDLDLARSTANRSLALQTKLFGAASQEAAGAELQMARVALARHLPREALAHAGVVRDSIRRKGRINPLLLADALLVSCAAHGEIGERTAAVVACTGATSLQVMVLGLDPASLRKGSRAVAAARLAARDH